MRFDPKNKAERFRRKFQRKAGARIGTGSKAKEGT